VILAAAVNDEVVLDRAPLVAGAGVGGLAVGGLAHVVRDEAVHHVEGRGSLRRAAALLLLAGLAAGWSREGTADAVSDRPLTDAERERAIARSPLPGAPVVGRAIAARDTSAVRSARANALPR
jgi:hypothetical protein